MNPPLRQENKKKGRQEEGKTRRREDKKKGGQEDGGERLLTF